MAQWTRKGFSLIELLAVITIIGVLSVFVIPRLGLIKTNSPTASLVSAINLARSLALYSSNREESIQLLLANNIISVRKNNIDIAAMGFDYPKSIPSDVRHEPQSVLLSFNTLGETQSTTILFIAANAEHSITVHATGYAE